MTQGVTWYQSNVHANDSSATDIRLRGILAYDPFDSLGPASMTQGVGWYPSDILALAHLRVKLSYDLLGCI